MIRPTQLNQNDRLVGVRGNPLFGHFHAHGVGNASLVTASNGDAGISQRAEEGGHDQTFVQRIHYARLGSFGVPDLHRGCVHTLGNDLVNVLSHYR